VGPDPTEEERGIDVMNYNSRNVLALAETKTLVCSKQSVVQIMESGR